MPHNPEETIGTTKPEVSQTELANSDRDELDSSIERRQRHIGRFCGGQFARCNFPWKSMQSSTSHVRLCPRCLQFVYEVDGLNEQEIVELIKLYDPGKANIPRLFRRSDGRYMVVRGFLPCRYAHLVPWFFYATVLLIVFMGCEIKWILNRIDLANHPSKMQALRNDNVFWELGHADRLDGKSTDRRSIYYLDGGNGPQSKGTLTLYANDSDSDILERGEWSPDEGRSLKWDMR